MCRLGKLNFFNLEWCYRSISHGFKQRSMEIWNWTNLFWASILVWLSLVSSHLPRETAPPLGTRAFQREPISSLRIEVTLSLSQRLAIKSFSPSLFGSVPTEQSGGKEAAPYSLPRQTQHSTFQVHVPFLLLKRTTENEKPAFYETIASYTLED